MKTQGKQMKIDLWDQKTNENTGKTNENGPLGAKNQ